MSVLLSLKSPGLWCAEKRTGHGNGKAHRADVVEIPEFDEYSENLIKFDDRSSKNFFQERIYCGNAGNTV